MTGAAGGERSRLIRALALSRRFHLYVARCASPRAAAGLIAQLFFELPRLGRDEMEFVLLEPYSGRAEDTPLTDGELSDRILLPLLDPPEELCGAIHIIDASHAANVDTAAWARFFSLWNEKRNLMRPPRGEVVVMLPAALAPVFAAAAPDVWSIRSGEYVIDEDASARGSLLELLDLDVLYRGSRSVVSSGRTAGFPVARVSAIGGTLLYEGLRLLFAASPLALFGGDLVVRPWVEDLLSAAASPELIPRTSYGQSASEGAEPSVVAQRKLRLAESALAERRFNAAEELFSELLESDDGHDAEQTVRALSALCISLAAQGRAAEAVDHGARALLLIGFERRGDAIDARLSPDVRARALRANALVQWCLGHLADAERLDRAILAVSSPSVERDRSLVLRLAERGQVTAARAELSELLRPRSLPSSARKRVQGTDLDPVALILATDLDLLAGDLDAALRRLEQASAEPRESWPEAHESLADRCGAALALVEIARGNYERASRLLARPRDAPMLPSRQIEPEAGSRADAFYACISGILAAVLGDRGGASAWFERALVSIAEWGRSGLDLRSRMRAGVAVELLWTMFQPEGDRALATARSLIGQAERLLGDTAEDHVSRVLAAAAHLEFAQRLLSVDGGNARAAAQRAVALAQPLGNLDVPVWDELVLLLHTAERSL
ncbi:tetratricopeptide repeat protein [Sorangium sp. So ce296]|uniref:tetratricopeptide repeat protein n=1 Tax=Sorangium sp. So ce296 TaxID=3133296 RepID=UPI003F607B03